MRRDGSGFATFKVRFACVAFRPFKGEVLDCAVQSVNKVCGLMSVLVMHLVGRLQLPSTTMFAL